MTLVLSCLTPDHVFQVADRRLTWPDGRIADDDANKAVWFCGRMVLGYTGQAVIARHATDLWMVKVLARAQDLNAAVTTIAEQATRAFQTRFTTGRHPPHAFEAVAWARFPPSTRFEPFMCGISNFHDGNGVRLPRTLDGFSVWVDRLGRRPALISTVSVLSPSEEARLSRTLSTVVKRGLRPDAVARLLVEELWRVAGSNGLVGPGLLASAIPRASIQAGQPSVELVNSGPLGDVPTFWYVAADRDEWRQVGPRLTCGGNGMTVEEFVIEPL